MSIKKLRLRCGMTQQEFAKTIGMSLSTLRSWEQNKRACKSWLYKLIEYYMKNEGYLN